MATYYVKTDGSNSASGISPATAWQTIAYAAGQVSAGDTIWIAPGVYPDAVSLVAAGGSGTEIRWKGDPNLTQAWTSVVPGLVRLSSDDNNDGTGTPTSTIPFDFNGQDYNECYDLIAEGTTDRAFQGNSASVNQKCIRCMGISASFGFEYLKCEYCVGIAGYGGFYHCEDSNGPLKWCLAVGGYLPYQDCDTDRCLVLGGGYCMYGGYHRNATMIGGDTMMRNIEANCDNNLLLGGYFASHSTTNINNSLYACCYSESNADDDQSNNRKIYIYDANAVTNPAASGHCFVLPPPMEMIRHISAAFHIGEWNDYDMSDGTASTENDIEGRDNLAYGKTHLGCQSIAKKSFPADGQIKIEREGEEIFYLNIAASGAPTVAVNVAYDLDSGTDHPQLVVEGAGLSTKTDTGSGSPTTLTIAVDSGDPTHNTVAKIILKAKESNANAYAIFSNLRVV